MVDGLDGDMPKLKKHAGKITITRPTGGKRGASISIQIQDETSGVTFFAGEMSLANFAECVTGHGYVDIEFEVRRSDLIGMKAEHKTEVVEFDPPRDAAREDRKGLEDYERSPLVNKALAPFEVDGWRGYPSDLFNHHRWVGNDTKRYTVSFSRHVDPETGRPVV